MALDYSPLLAIDPGGAFLRGRERAIARGEREEAQADRNLLRQAQMEQMAAQRENMLAQRQEREAQTITRRAQEQRAIERQRLLSGAAAALRQGGYPFNRDVLQQILASAVEADEPTLYKFATETMKALDEEDLYKREASRLGMSGAAPTTPAAPSVMRQPAPAMTAAPPNLLAGTPYDIGVGAPAPTNALAAPQPAPTGGFTRDQVQQMLTSPSARIREQGKALASTLPKDVQPQVRTIDTGAEILTEEYNPSTGATRVLSRQKKAMSPAEIATDVREAKRIGLETRRVVIAEENARRDADPGFQQRMAAARATGDAIAKGDVAAQRALPQIIGRAEEGLRLIDNLIGKAEVKDAKGKVVQAGTKPHPGFQDAVGATWKPGLRFVPGTDAADFMARFDQINGQAFLEAFESLKGGGAITEKEGTKGTEAINRARIAQSEREFITAMRDLQDVVRKGVENTRRKSLVSPAASGGTPAAGQPTVSNW